MEELEANETPFTAERALDANGDLTIKLVGELDISSASTFRTIIEPVVTDHCERLIFDLRELKFMDSSGIAVMVYAANHVGEIELRHPSAIVRRIVEATGLAEILRLDPS